MSSIAHRAGEWPAPSSIALFAGAADAGRDTPAVYLDRLLRQAVRQQASDIHIEPTLDGGQIRLRLDGLLHLHDALAPSQFSRLGLYIKAIAGLDIAEKRLPQDGRLGLELAPSERIELRISSLPTLRGEKIVLRLLKNAATRLDIESLGYEPAQQARYLAAIGRASGLVLVGGPTGSGKTSSLYAALAALNHEQRNILTIEDPVEIQLPGLHQVQCAPKQGLGFAAVLRALLRQDPDVIMLGEIRDRETAEIALQAAQTGHLVLSTLHAQDAAQSLLRLLQLGVAPHLIAASLSLVVAQRLVRRLHVCRRPLRLDREALHRAGFDAPTIAADPVLYQPHGCPHCRDGYLGRTGVYQLLAPSAALRQPLLAGQPGAALAALLTAPDPDDLRAAVLRKVAQGVTSLAEADRVIPPCQV